MIRTVMTVYHEGTRRSCGLCKESWDLTSLVLRSLFFIHLSSLCCCLCILSDSLFHPHPCCFTACSFQAQIRNSPPSLCSLSMAPRPDSIPLALWLTCSLGPYAMGAAASPAPSGSSWGPQLIAMFPDPVRTAAAPW